MNAHTTPRLTAFRSPASRPDAVVHAELHVDGRTLRLPLDRDPAEASAPDPGFVERAFRHRIASGRGDSAVL